MFLSPYASLWHRYGRVVIVIVSGVDQWYMYTSVYDLVFPRLFTETWNPLPKKCKAPGLSTKLNRKTGCTEFEPFFGRARKSKTEKENCGMGWIHVVGYFRGWASHAILILGKVKHMNCLSSHMFTLSLSHHLRASGGAFFWLWALLFNCFLLPTLS